MSFDFNTVSLVAHTCSYVDFQGIEEYIAYVARVSNPGNQNNNATAPKLLKYMVDHEHWSPFEMASVCLEIRTPRDIARQILRHRSFSFQEFSQRYSSDIECLTGREARLQDAKNRQSSIQPDNPELGKKVSKLMVKAQGAALDAYVKMLEMGIAKECARAVLPEGLTMTRMYMHGTVRSWYHYCKLRMGNGTQLEHQDIAEKCYDTLQPLMPNIFNFKEKKE